MPAGEAQRRALSCLLSMKRRAKAEKVERVGETAEKPKEAEVLTIPEGWDLHDPDETRRKKARFLIAMINRPAGKPPNIAKCSRAAGITRATAYRWREDDSSFAEAWDEAKEEALDNLEEVVYEQGATNVVAAFGYLKAYRGEYWREKQQLDIHTTGQIELAPANLDELKAELARLAVDAQRKGLLTEGGGG
jgi:hypothetical protein